MGNVDLLTVQADHSGRIDPEKGRRCNRTANEPTPSCIIIHGGQLGPVVFAVQGVRTELEFETSFGGRIRGDKTEYSPLGPQLNRPSNVSDVEIPAIGGRRVSDRFEVVDSGQYAPNQKFRSVQLRPRDGFRPISSARQGIT